MRGSSLARRLYLTAAVVSAIVLVLSGFLLSSLYRASVERAFDRRLTVYLKTIVVDVASAPSGTLPDPAPLGEPLFQIPVSGWYWQITRTTGDIREIKRSPSVPADTTITLEEQKVPLRTGGGREGYKLGPEDQILRVVEREIDLGEDGRYLASVAADAGEIDDEVDDFNDAIMITFGFLGLIFLVTAWFQVRFGLRPLKHIQAALSAIRSGRAEKLEGNFPSEVAPLAGEVNALIESNREIVDRARTHVGNLAHALKTPLSVLLNETAIRDDAVAEKVREQVAVMREQVQRHLERARLAARIAVIGTVIDVTPAVNGVLRTMEKVHRGRSLAMESRIMDEVKFHGEQQDLEEMLGNLIDNACKWAASRIDIEIFAERQQQPGGRSYFHIVVDDDGPGLSPDSREDVLKNRGRRLDESKPGSGLGLSIVVDLAALYAGRLELGTAPIGGLRAELVLPAAT